MELHVVLVVQWLRATSIGGRTSTREDKRLGTVFMALSGPKAVQFRVNDT